jgi:hypothetical protein
MQSQMSKVRKNIARQTVPLPFLALLVLVRGMMETLLIPLNGK